MVVIARVPYRQTERRSELLFHFRASDLEFGDPRNPSTGALKPVNALTRQAVAFTRASTATAVDRQGATYTVGHSLPAWSWIDGKPALLVRPASSPRTVESMEVTFNYATLKSHSGYVAFYAPDGFPQEDVPLLHWGDAAVYDISDWAYYFDTATTPTSSQLVELRWTVASDGAVTLGVAVAGGSELVGTASAATSGANTTPSTSLWIGSRGTTDTSGLAIATVKIAAGTFTMQDLREMI